MTLMALFFLLVPSVCAVLAGTVVWASNRNQVLEDASLIRQFLLILSICLLVAWGVSRTTTFRLRVDPAFALQTALDSHPLYLGIKEHAPDDAGKLHAALTAQTAQGKTLADAFAQVRPLLSRMARYRVGFSDQRTVLRWAQVSIETLKELRAKDPVLCVQSLLPPPADQLPLSLPFSPANVEAFEGSLISLYASAGRTMRRERSPTDQPVTSEETQLAYSAITEQIQQRFGLEFDRSTAVPSPAVLQSASPGLVCDAVIFRLEAMQARPQPIAAGLLRNTLRD